MGVSMGCVGEYSSGVSPSFIHRTVTYPRWIYFLDVQFTLMIFGVLKLMPIISVHGFNFLSTHINVIVPIVQKYSRLFQMFFICWSNGKSIFMDNESMVFICWIFCKY
jgi:hypothetical protein